MRHAVAGERRAVVVEHPAIGADVAVQRDRDGVDPGGQRPVRLVLPDAGMGTHGRGDRHVTGELGEEAGVHGLVVGHVSEPDPDIELRGPDGRIRVIGVRVVDDAQVSAGDPHVVDRAFVRPGRRRCGIRVTDDIGRGDVEKERAHRTGSLVLHGPSLEHGERASIRDFVQLDVVLGAGVGCSRENQRCRHRSPPGRVPGRGDDALAEDLAGLDDRPHAVGVEGARVTTVALGLDVHDPDEVGGVAPVREPLDRDVALVVARRRRRRLRTGRRRARSAHGRSSSPSPFRQRPSKRLVSTASAGNHSSGNAPGVSTRTAASDSATTRSPSRARAR